MSPAHHRTPLSRHGGAIGDLREHNLATLMWELVREGTLSRLELGQSAGLSPAAVSKLVAELRERGLAREAPGPTVGGRGRPSTQVSLETERWMLVGAVLGQSEMHMVLSLLDGTPVAETRTPITDPADHRAYLGHLLTAVRGAAIEAAERGLQILAVELSVTGGVSRRGGTVVFSPTLHWREVNVCDPVTAELRSCTAGVAPAVTVSLDSDANHAMVGRLDREAAPGDFRLIRTGRSIPRSPSAVYFGGPYTVGGAIYNGAVERGTDGLAGQLGHMWVTPSGPLCWCGRRGCLESSIGIAALHAAIFGAGPSAEAGAEPMPLRNSSKFGQILAALDAGDPVAEQVCFEAGATLGVAIDSACAVLNPATVIVDGYLSRLGDTLAAGLESYLATIWHASEYQYPTISFAPPGDVTARGCLIMAAQTVAANPGTAR